MTHLMSMFLRERKSLCSRFSTERKQQQVIRENEMVELKSNLANNKPILKCLFLTIILLYRVTIHFLSRRH